MKSWTADLVPSRELLSPTISPHARLSGATCPSRASSVRRSDEARLKVGMTMETSGLDLIAVCAFETAIDRAAWGRLTDRRRVCKRSGFLRLVSTGWKG